MFGRDSVVKEVVVRSADAASKFDLLWLGRVAVALASTYWRLGGDVEIPREPQNERALFVCVL